MTTPSYNRIQSFLVASEHTAPEPVRAQLPALTISREAGTGATRIAHLVAAEMEKRQVKCEQPWAVFDANLVMKVLEDHGLPDDISEYMPEDRRPAVRETVEEILGAHPSSSTLLNHTSRTILRLARTGNVVIIGRAGNVISSHLKHVLQVRLVAPLEWRVRNLQESQGISRRAAMEYIRLRDRGRARYVMQNFNSRIEDPMEYDLVINVASISAEVAARMIADLLMRMPVAPAPQLRPTGASMVLVS